MEIIKRDITSPVTCFAWPPMRVSYPTPPCSIIHGPTYCILACCSWTSNLQTSVLLISWVVVKPEREMEMDGNGNRNGKTIIALMHTSTCTKWG